MVRDAIQLVKLFYSFSPTLPLPTSPDQGTQMQIKGQMAFYIPGAVGHSTDAVGYLLS